MVALRMNRIVPTLILVLNSLLTIALAALRRLVRHASVPSWVSVAFEVAAAQLGPSRLLDAFMTQAQQYAQTSGSGKFPGLLQCKLPLFKPFFFIIDPEALQEVLVRSPQAFHKDVASSRSAFADFVGNNIVTADGPGEESWERFHRGLKPIQGQNFAKDSFRFCWLACKVETRRVMSELRSRSTDEVDLFCFARDYLLPCQWKTFFGDKICAERFPDLAEDLVSTISESMRAQTAGLPYPMFRQTEYLTRLERVKQAVNYILANGDIHVPLYNLVVELLEDDLIDETEAFNHVDVILYALAPMHTAFWSLYWMAQHPEWITRIRQEIKENVEIEESEAGGHPAYETLTRKMPELDKVIREVLRLAPPVPISIGRRASYECKLSGVTVPKDSMLFYSTYLNHRNPAYFDNPDRFNPDREWTMESLQAYSPFGLGARVCTGRELGKLLTRSFIVTLLQNFDIVINEDSLSAHTNLQCTSGFLAPVESVKARVTPRTSVLQDIYL